MSFLKWIGSALTWLQAWLLSSPRRTSRKWHPDLNPIDIHQLSKELNLKAEAQRLGNAGVPHEPDSTLTGPESAIVQKVELARQDYVAWGELRLKSLNQELSRRDVTSRINESLQADQEFERKASSELTINMALLNDLSSEVRSRKSELEKFKNTHSIDRLPNMPTGKQRTYIFVLAVVFILFEGVVNAFFFSMGLNSGLIGGFFQAALAAATNVVLLFLIGHLFARYIFHRNLMLNIFGLFSSAVGLAISFGIGLAVAHYRDALVQGLDNATSVARDTLIGAPFGLSDLMSWALLVLSVVFGLGALIDGFFLDDRYPGFGAISRKYNDAIDALNAEIDALHDFLEQLKEETLLSLEKAAEHSASAVAVFSNLVDEKRLAGGRLSNATLEADNALDALLNEFRTENKVARGGSPSPAYFNTRPRLRSLKIPRFDVAEDERSLARQRQLLKTLVSELQNIRARIQNAYTQRFNALKTLDSQFSSDDGKSQVVQTDGAPSESKSSVGATNQLDPSEKK